MEGEGDGVVPEIFSAIRRSPLFTVSIVIMGDRSSEDQQ